MALIYSVILCLFLKFRTCQLQCVKETLNVKDFSINVTTHIEAKYGACIRIPYEFTIPANKVQDKIKMIWFREDPQYAVSTKVIKNPLIVTKEAVMIDGPTHGESEYGLKLEFQCNQTYIFPTRVRVSVSGSLPEPTVLVPNLKEGQRARLTCLTHQICNTEPNIRWRRTKTDEVASLLPEYWNYLFGRATLYYIPTAYDHNTTITCEANYPNKIVVERTVTLTVQFAPRFLNGSQCIVKGMLLVCVCISWGNPPSPIAWPLASLTDFSVTSYSSVLTVNSTITIPAADYHNTSVTCISSNEMGQRLVEIQIQNSTEDWNFNSDGGQTLNAALPWILAVSFILNLVLLTILIVYIYKRAKMSKEKLSEEMTIYTSLNRAQVEQDYSVISPQHR